MKLSKRQIEALEILRETTHLQPVSARKFAELFWPDSNMHLKSSNQGNRATSGKAAWLCAGSYVGKLVNKKLVGRAYDPTGYYITQYGWNALVDHTGKFKKESKNG